MTQRMCKACGDWHDLDEQWPDHCIWELSARRAKRFGTAPYVISDTMRALRHHGTGEIIDSKAKFRAATKASGCVEIGNSLPVERQPIKLDRAKRREDIGRAWYKVKNGIKDGY